MLPTKFGCQRFAVLCIEAVKGFLAFPIFSILSMMDRQMLTTQKNTCEMNTREKNVPARCSVFFNKSSKILITISETFNIILF